MEQTLNILVVFYSLSGKTAALAHYIAEGAKSFVGTNVTLKQVPELMPQSFFDQNPKLQAQRQSFANVPLATIDDLTAADGIAFGSPVHFGSFASQMKQFIDQLSPVFIRGTLTNKPASLFTTSGSMHGGEEVALLSFMIPLLNLGMLPVGVPYPIQGESPRFDAGSPYGAIFVSGHQGEKEITEADIKIAHILGRRLAAVAKVLKHGTETCTDCAFLSQSYE